MSGPIAFDPAGPCVILLSRDKLDAYLFHVEILKKSKTKCAEEDPIKSLASRKQDQDNDERPPEVQTGAGGWLLKLFKHWAYHGNFGNSACQTLTATLNLIQGNRENIGVDAFEDAFVDQAIEILTSDHELTSDEFRACVLDHFREWPSGFQDFALDALFADDAAEYWQQFEHFVDEAQHALDDEFGDDQELVLEFAKRGLQRRFDPHKIRGVDSCKYHSHGYWQGCYKKTGAVDLTKEPPCKRGKKRPRPVGSDTEEVGVKEEPDSDGI